MARLSTVGIRLATLLVGSGLLAGEPAPQPLSLVRKISRRQAEKRQEVRTYGVVTYVSNPRRVIFIQQGAEAIAIIDAQRTPVNPGDRIWVNGRMAPGGYAPVIEATSVQSMGRGMLPPAVPVEIPDLLVGDFDCARVRLEGRLRSIDFSQPKIFLRIEQHGHLIRVRVDALTRQQTVGWLGRRLRVTAIAGSVFNLTGQMTDALLYAASASDLALLPGQTDHAAPVMPIAGLLTFDSTRRRSHAVRVEGRVTLSPDDHFLVVQDATGAIAVETAVPKRWPIGSAVAVAGYAKFGGIAAEVSDGVVTSISSADPAVPVRSTPQQLLKDSLEARLVTLEGTLVSISTDANRGYHLRFQHAGRDFQASLASATAPLNFEPGNFEPGTRFDVTGVVSLVTSLADQTNLRWFRLQMRSVEDLRVLGLPPYWNRDRTFRLVLILLLGCAVPRCGSCCSAAGFARKAFWWKPCKSRNAK